MLDSRELETGGGITSGRSTTAARTVAASSDIPTGRTVSNRASISSRTGPGQTFTTDPIGSPGPAPEIDSRSIARSLIGAGLPVTPDFYASLFPDAAAPPSGTQDAPTGGTTIGGSGPGSYGDQYGFPGVLADLFLRTFGADSTDKPQAPVVVGDAGMASSSGGANTLLIVLVVAGIAGAGYYFFVYKKKHGGE